MYTNDNQLISSNVSDIDKLLNLDLSCYEILGIPHTASYGDIKKSYNKLSLIYHPDKYRGTEEETAKAKEIFKRVTAAYKTLINEEERASYDAALKLLEKAQFSPYEAEYMLERAVANSRDEIIKAIKQLFFCKYV
ncbi:MAG: DnaJ domain-containing protein [bacterium]